MYLIAWFEACILLGIGLGWCLEHLIDYIIDPKDQDYKKSDE